jgi:hypothetical protein
VTRRARLPLAAALLLLATGCRLDVRVGLDVEDDGSGKVTVSAGLDDDALTRIGNLERQLEVDDLKAAGWTVTGPAKDADDDLTWVRATKPFATPAEAAAVMAEINGDRGPFRDFELRKSRSFARTTWRFTGRFDFGEGLAAFSDEQLTQALDGEPLGQSVEEIEAQLGAAIDRLVGIQVAVRLPGDISSNAPTEADNGAVWDLSVRDARGADLEATGRDLNRPALAWAVAALLCGIALVGVLIVRVARALRRSVG